MKPLVSIIIPTYNEEEDIRRTLNACVSLSYYKKEIIVVDDSNDNTPQIVREFEDKGVKLIQRKENKGGRCGARNRGIKESRGEILIILNADVILPPDFIERILPYYEEGAGFVLVQPKILNTDNPIPRFIQADGKMRQRGDWDWVCWTEGFSCLREAAFDAGLFPIPPLPLLAGEDGYFGRKILEKGYKRVIDRSIKVGHYTPYRLKDFWRNRRGRVSSIASYFLEGKSIFEIFVRAAGRTILFFTIFPSLFRGFRLTRYSKQGIKDFLPFVFIDLVQESAFLVGKWESLYKLIRFRIKDYRVYSREEKNNFF
jgi:glycosyltransferase involved in cell wall biosynthesis